jgi:hypothetical protein
VNGKLIKNETIQVITTTNGLLDRNLGNSSNIDVIGTSVKANYISTTQISILNKKIFTIYLGTKSKCQ